MDNNAELKKEFQQKKREVAELRAKLQGLHQEKENLFQQMRSSRDSLTSRLDRIKKLKQERDQLTNEVKKLKEARNQLNVEVKEKSQQLKVIENKQQDVGEKAKSKGDHAQESPGRLWAMIQRLETTIETEVMSFDKEKQLNKKIKELKQQYQKGKVLEGAQQERHTAATDFSQKRREAQHSHITVQEKAEESQKKHEELLELYDELKKIREEMKPLDEKRNQLRLQSEETKKQLDEVVHRVRVLGKVFDEREESSFQSKVREKTT